MAHASWGPGWPNCQTGRIKTLVRSDGLRLPIREELHPMVRVLMDETERIAAGRGGYDIRPDWTWGYACRAIRGSNKPSNHSNGTAIDINAPTNPMGSRLITDMPMWMVRLWEAHGWRWGGSYRTRPDAMHYEFMLSVDDAIRIGRDLTKPKSPAKPTVVVAKLPVYQENKKKGIPIEIGPVATEIEERLNRWIKKHKPLGLDGKRIKPVPVNHKYDDVDALTIVAFKLWVISLQRAFKLPVWPNSDTAVGPVTYGALDFWGHN